MRFFTCLLCSDAFDLVSNRVLNDLVLEPTAGFGHWALVKWRLVTI